MSNICFYHIKDLDGRCAGAIVKRAFPDCRMIGIDYQEEFPWEQIGIRDTVYMVDVSLEPFSEMLRLNDICHNLIWIDHHKTQKDEHDKSSCRIANYIYSDKYSACELAWQYFNIYEDIPYAVRLLGRYDVWDHNSFPNVRKFQAGLLGKDTSIDSQIWEDIFNSEDSFISEIIELGEAIMYYQDKRNKWFMRYAFRVQFEGVNFLCLNNAQTGSLQFESMFCPEIDDATLVFYLTPEKNWSIHMYTEKPDINLGDICKKYGGGGHRTCGGFKTDKIDFLLK